MNEAKLQKVILISALIVVIAGSIYYARVLFGSSFASEVNVPAGNEVCALLASDSITDSANLYFGGAEWQTILKNVATQNKLDPATLDWLALIDKNGMTVSQALVIESACSLSADQVVDFPARLKDKIINNPTNPTSAKAWPAFCNAINKLTPMTDPTTGKSLKLLNNC